MNTDIFQYSILHYRHDLITKEFLNVGVVAYCEKNRQFKCRINRQLNRISATFPGVDLRYLQKYLTQLQTKFDLINKDISNDKFAIFSKYSNELDSIIKSVLQFDDSSVYFSQVQSTTFENFDKKFESIYQRYILRYNKERNKERRNDHDVWETYKESLDKVGILSSLKRYTIDVTYDKIEFDYGWKNGKVNAIQPISFDMVNPTLMKKKAKEWVGNITLLDKSDQISNLYLVIGNPSKQDPELMSAYEDTKNILLNRPDNFEVTIVEEDDALNFAQDIKPKIEADLSLHNTANT